jgi:hypothetical protein
MRHRNMALDLCGQVLVRDVIGLLKIPYFRLIHICATPKQAYRNLN